MIITSQKMNAAVLAVVSLLAVNPAEVRAEVRTADDARPNILFAFADDWGRFASAYAESDGSESFNELVRTPSFDRISDGGVLFRHAFVNAPSCTPCRSSILSGQHFWRTGRGAILQGAVWDPKIPVWPLLLKDGGYHIGKTWKVWSPGVPVDAPFGGRQHAYQQAGSRFNQFSQNVERLVANGKTVDEAKSELLAEVKGNFQDFLHDRQDGQPFCYWFGPTNVHRKWIQGSGQKFWGLNPDRLQGRMPPFLPDVPKVREDLADYMGEIMAFDRGLGVLLGELDRIGELDKTMIVVSGDHGPPGFPHGKCNLYDFGTHVSLAISGPGVVAGRVVDDFVTLPDLGPTFLEYGGVDIPDVMTGRSLKPVLESERSGLVDSSRTWVLTGRERHVAAARDGNLPYPQRAIRTQDFLFITNFRPDRYPLGDPYRLQSDQPPTVEELTQNTFATLPDEDAGPAKAWIVTHRNDPRWKPYFDHAYGKRPREQLFDLRRDPHQMNNVAADPEYAEISGKLRKQLLSELKRTGDPRVVEEGSFFENPPLAGPIPEDAKRRRN